MYQRYERATKRAIPVVVLRAQVVDAEAAVGRKGDDRSGAKDATHAAEAAKPSLATEDTSPDVR